LSRVIDSRSEMASCSAVTRSATDRSITFLSLANELG
jgi:hypothetical protein